MGHCFNSVRVTVVNLDRRTDRWADIQKSIAKAQEGDFMHLVDRVERFSAVSPTCDINQATHRQQCTVDEERSIVNNSYVDEHMSEHLIGVAAANLINQLEGSRVAGSRIFYLF